MQKATIVLAFAAVFMAVPALAQEIEFAWTVDPSTEGPYSTNHSGARQVAGPFDLDGDGKMEVLVADYTLGGRVHVLENIGADTWELIWSTPALDATNSTNNLRTATAGDMDGDGFGEVIFMAGDSYDAANPLSGRALFIFEATGDNTFSETPVIYILMDPHPTAGEPSKWAQPISMATAVTKSISVTTERTMIMTTGS